MKRLAASLAVAIAAVSAGSTVPSRGLELIGSDATALLLPLGVNKSVVIDLPRDVQEVLIADPNIVKAVVRTNRRVNIIGGALGQSNVYFFDAAGRQIGAINVVVAAGPQPAEDQL